MAKPRGELAKTPGWFGKKGQLFPDDLGYTPAVGRRGHTRPEPTFVNNISIQPDEPVRLANRDLIQVGEVVAHYAAVSALYEHS